MKRPPIHLAAVDSAITRIQALIAKRLDQHGPGVYVGAHEAAGIIAEEYHEMMDALKQRDGYQHFDDECLDLAVASIIAVASRQTLAAMRADGADV